MKFNFLLNFPKALGFLFLFPLALPVLSQVPTQTVRGTIIDAESKAVIEGATIAIISTNPIKGAISDAKGEFKIIEVPVGRHNVKVTLMGYEDKLVPEVIVGSGKEVILTIELTESIKHTEMAKVVIVGQEANKHAQNEMAVVSARSFSLDETKRYAASVNDPARMASAFAGVNASNDQSNEIVIRGNSPRGLLWRLEGIEIPNPNHFSEEGASGGGVSMLSSNMMDQSDFFTGAFPAEYGNALSGVFDIQLRRGNDQQREYAFQAGTLGADFALEGPFSKKSSASYLLNYRYSTLAVLKIFGLKVAGNAVPDYQDLSWRVHLPTKKFGVFSIFSLAGLSGLDDEAKHDSTKWKTENDRRNEKFSSDMGVLGASHFLFLGPNTYFKSIFAISGARVQYLEQRLNDNYDAEKQYREKYLSTNVRASFMLNKKFSVRHTVRTGLIFGQLGYDFFNEGINDSTGNVEQILSRSGGSQQWQAYTQWKFRISEKLTLNSGVHYMFFSMNRDHSVEPRLGFKWQASNKLSLSLGFGLHSRLEPMSTYLSEQLQTDGSWKQINKDIRFTRAAHFVLGYNYIILKDLHITIESYYQQLFFVPIEDDSTSSFSTLNYEPGLISTKLNNEGTGKNYGVDITLQKYLTHNWYFLGTFSLYNSTYMAGDGITRNTRFNGHNTLNLLAGREFHVGKKNDKSNLLSADLRMVWAGGQRYTPIDLDASQTAGDAVYLNNLRYTERAEDYFRFDIRFGYRKNRPKSSHILTLDIRNVTNRLNMFRMVYNPDTNQLEKSTQLGIIPVLNYRVEF